MINEFKATLQKYVSKKCELSEVTQRLELLLKKHPQLAEPIDSQIKQLADNKKVPQAACDAIQAITSGYLASTNDDKTMVTGDRADAVVNDKTEVMTDSTTSGAVEDNDSTEIGTDLPPSNTQTAATQASGDAGFNMDLDATGRSATATSPTIGPDGMPVMTHGDKVIGIGSVLRNRFELKTKLGEGGMGAVYMAIDKIKQEAQDKNDKVAVKVLNETFKQFRESFIALQRESSKQQRLAHPNIATVFDFDRDYTYDTVFMTMEMMDGQPLDEYIKKLPPAGLSYEEARPIIDGMCNGLAYAHHHNLVHSDFKPANTFLLKTGVVKLLDFGIARAAKPTMDADGNKETTLFDPGTLGALTPAYASAEMLEGETPEPPDDIYALACVTYQLLGGKHPYNKMPANQARDNHLKPAPIKKLKGRQMKGLLRGLAFNRKDRTPTVEQFLDEITPKKPVMLYAIAGALVVLSIIGFLGSGALKERFRLERVNNMIASIGNAGKAKNYAAIAENLKTMGAQKDNFDEATVTQIKADKKVQKAVIGYFSARIDKQIDKTKGQYNYPAAYKILFEARSHYPDSGKIEDIQDTIDKSKADELDTQRDLYNLLTTTGPWLPVDGPGNDIPDVIQTIKTIEPRNQLLADPRLVGSYLKQIKATREEEKFDISRKLITQAAIYEPDNIALVNEKDELELAKFEAGKQKLLLSLSQKVQQAGATSGLNRALGVSKELAQMRLISPDNLILNSVSKTSTAELIRGLSTAKNKTAISKIANQFLALAPALSNAQQEQVRKTLNLAWQKSGGADSAYSQQLSNKADALSTQIDSVSSKAAFSHEWTQSLKQLVAELQALMGSSNIKTQQAKRKIAVQLLEQATQASKGSRLTESRIQLAYAKQFDAKAPGLVASELAIRQALDKQEREILERIRVATISAFKADLLAKARAEKVGDAKKFLEALKVYLLPRDNFLTTEGPNAIGTAYANIALRIKKRADALTKDYLGQRDSYAAALKQIAEGQKTAPNSKDLASAYNQIQHGMGAAEVNNILKTADKLNIASLSNKLNKIRSYNPDDYSRLKTVFSNVVAERLGTMVVYDLLNARTFVDSALRLPIDLGVLRRIKRAMPVYKPSKFANNIREAIKTSLLSKASQVLSQALSTESDHPEIKTLRGILASKTTAAKKLYKQYKAQAKIFKLDEARASLSEAIEIWKDRDEYLVALKNIDRLLKQPAGEKPRTKKEIIEFKKQLGVPCTARLAKYGRRKQGLCYDGLPGGQAPILVVLPAGAGHPSPFAMTKFEISIRDYNFYCKSTKKCQSTGGNQKLPITGISLVQAKEYAAWLSKVTQTKYSIPSEEEWLFAANSGGKKTRGKNYNCTLRLGDKIIKGTGLQDIDSGKQNAWGLVNYIGNAQEWVESASGTSARGGAYTDAMLKCSIELQRPHDGSPDNITTFRLVRDIT